MTPVWPSDLPPPMRSSFQTQRQDARLRRAAETGPPAYRRRYSSVGRDISMTIDVTRVQKATFDIFHEQTVSDGSLAFWMPNWTSDGWPLLSAEGQPLLLDDGRPLLMSARSLCLFGPEMPVETIIGVRFQIAFAVTVLP